MSVPATSRLEGFRQTARVRFVSFSHCLLSSLSGSAPCAAGATCTNHTRTSKRLRPHYYQALKRRDSLPTKVFRRLVPIFNTNRKSPLHQRSFHPPHTTRRRRYHPRLRKQPRRCHLLWRRQAFLHRCHFPSH